jgi:hypothetical protein
MSLPSLTEIKLSQKLFNDVSVFSPGKAIGHPKEGLFTVKEKQSYFPDSVHA